MLAKTSARHDGQCQSCGLARPFCSARSAPKTACTEIVASREPSSSSHRGTASREKAYKSSGLSTPSPRDNSSITFNAERDQSTARAPTSASPEKETPRRPSRTLDAPMREEASSRARTASRPETVEAK